jgi:enterochelin esterase-like enzyme
MRGTWATGIFVGILLSLGIGDPAAGSAQEDQEISVKWVNELPVTAHPRLRHGTFHSAAMNVDVGYVVYVPPGYEDAANHERRYPVVYLLHGSGSTEVTGLGSTQRFDDAIRSGLIPPRLYVFVNGGSFSYYDFKDSLAETAFIKELIPHIDRTYRTFANRMGRAIEGFSMGSRATARDIFKYPELFCSAAALSGIADAELRAAENNGAVRSTRNVGVMNNAWDLARRYAASTATPPIDLLVTVGADDPQRLRSTEKWTSLLRSLGITFEYHVVPGVPHNLPRMYEAIGDTIIRHHEQCFSKLNQVESTR